MTSIRAMVPVTSHAAPTRRERLVRALRDDFGRLFGLPPEQVEPGESFLALGADSLFLIRASRTVQERFGVRVAFRRMLEDVDTVDALAAHLDAELPPEAPREGPAAVPALRIVAPPPTPEVEVEDGALRRILAQQVELMSLQLEALAGVGVAALPAAGGALAEAAPLAAHSPAPEESADAAGEEEETPLEPRQAAHLEALVHAVATREAASREAAERERAVLADPRAPRYRRRCAAALPPVRVERAEGGRVWDADGNEFLDLGLEGGALLFGHSPGWMAEALAAAAAGGLRAGARTALAGEVAALVAEATGAERVCFTASHTEAVMAALRLARAVSERSCVAVFAGAEHGTFDGTLARRLGLEGAAGALPSVPGIPPGMLRDVLVLEHGDPGALRALRARGGELAAVLVEPFRGGRPGADPGPFLREVAAACVDAGAAFVVDEGATGFRLHPGGAQGLCGVRADLAVYAGIPGSALPLGIVAGRSAWMAPVDGGEWCAEEGSYPLSPTTRVAGTGGGHPLVLAAARAALLLLRDEGSALLAGVHARAADAAARLRDVFDRRGTPLRVHHAGCDLRIAFPAGGREVEEPLFHLHLRTRGVLAGEDRVLRFCAAHAEADAARLAAAAEEAVAAMRADGFLGGEPAGVRDLPLSPGQRDLWLLAQMGEDASRACHESLVLRLRGPFDRRALEAALAGLVERHEALRTSFPGDGTRRVHPAGALRVRVEETDLAGAGESEAALAAALAEEIRRPLDLAAAPVLRARVFRLDAGDHTVALVLHHLLTDGWSNGVLLAELRALYEAAVAGVPAALPPAPRAGEGDDSGEETALRHWTAELAGARVLDLPADAPRPPLRGFSGALLRHPLDPALRAALARAAEAHGATPFAVLLAVFRLFLHRLSGEDDVVVGAVAAAGARLEAGDAVGSLVDVLPLRSRMEGDPSFAALLGDSRDRLAAALEQGGVSLARLAQALGLPRDPARPPLVSAVLNFHRTDGSRFAVGGAEGEVLQVHNGGAKFDLAVAAVETGDAIVLEWEYRLDLFHAETVRGWAAACAALLADACAHPERPVSVLEMLPAGERARVLGAWSGAGRAPVLRPPVHVAVAARAARDPGAPAVVWGERVLSAGALDARAVRLAARFRALGVGPETRVALHLERGPEMVVAMVAVLKAGGAYLPLDPELPSERASWMLADAGAVLLVTQSHLRAAAPPSGVPVLVLEEEDGGAEGGALPVLDIAEPDPDALAYVLYTSGSTGRPKGVEVTHGALANHMAWMASEFPLAPDDAVLQKTPFGFDASVWEFWAPLMAGARLVLAPRGAHRDAAALVRALRDGGITVLQGVPVLLRTLAETPGLDACRSLRLVFAGGEPLDRGLPARLRERLPTLGVVNLYGPTECCIDATFHRCGEAEGADGDVPIGTPVGGVRVYVLDGALRPLPIALPGEACVGGAQVARGYAGRPALTAERFVPDPFAGVPGARMYRTGDRVCRRADGALEYLGRSDGQVKVRGVRLELREVEAALRALPGVGAAAAGVVGGRGAERLAAWLVAAGERPGERALREGLRRTLPEAMVPSTLVWLEALPLTPGGKLDRRALPAPAAEAAAHVPPATPTEAALAALWEGTLGVERVGAGDDFFALGGHSLSAMSVLAGVEEALGVRLPLAAVFAAPTVAGLAAAVDAARAAAAPGEPVRPRAGEGPAPASFAQRRLWFLDRLAPGGPGYAMAGAVRLRGPLDAGALERAMAEVVARHEALRTVFEERAGEPV